MESKRDINLRKNLFLLVCWIIFTLTAVRLFDSIIKRELKSALIDLTEEYQDLAAGGEEIDARIREKEGEKTLLSLQRELAFKKEFYLSLHRRTKTAQLRLEDKSLREMRFSVKGRKAIEGEAILPNGILKVREKIKGGAFYIPDEMYELWGKEVPRDTLERKIIDAFGEYSISLGADIVLSGKVKEEVPGDLLDLIYIEFEKEAMEAIYNTLKEGALVFFF